VTDVRTRVVAAGELFITYISTRDPLGSRGVQGGNIRALVGKDFAATVTWNLPRYLAGRAGSRMTERRARVAAWSRSRTNIAARVRSCQSWRLRVDIRSAETPGVRSRINPGLGRTRDERTYRRLSQSFALHGIRCTTTRLSCSRYGPRMLSGCL
jgi:hypothetical protein